MMKQALTQLTLTMIMIIAAIPAYTQEHKDSATVLQPAKKELKGVTITAAKPFIVQKTDKIILNVAQSPIAAGDNVYEVIKRAPGVTDQQGLQFRGRSVSVYIEGRPTRLSGEDLQTYLSGMPANTVERVAIIPNPSAKYEAAGGAVINIILARNKSMGANGTLTAGMGAGKYARYNAGLSLNYRSKKVNVYGSYDIQHNQFVSRIYTQRSLADNSVVKDELYTLNKNNNNVFKAGFDYDINKNNSLGILVRGTVSRRKKEGDDQALLHYFSDGRDSASTVTTSNRSSLITPAINIYYKTRFGGKGGELTINADYYNYDKGWKDHFITRFCDGKAQEYAPPYLLRDNAPANNNIKSLSADYTMGNSIKYEMGIKTVHTKTDNNVTWEKNENGNWVNDLTKSNHFIYQENIHAAYITAAKSVKKVDVQAGVRLEQTNATGNSLTLSQVNKKSYTSLFPSLAISYNPSQQQQVGFSYNRKIERFGFNIINPFIVYQNQYAYSQGNPDIKPAYSHNFELSWSYNNEWLAAVSYNYYMDVLAEIYKKDATNNAMISTFDNVASANQVDMSVTYTKSLFNRKLTSSNTVGGLYAKYNAPAATHLDNASYAVSLSSNNILQLGKGWKGEMNMSWFSPFRFGAYQFRQQFGMSAGIAKTVLGDKGTLTLNVTDLFNSNKQRYNIESYGIRSINRNYTETRFVKLVFNYRLGNKNVKAGRNRKTGIDDVKGRMGN